LSTYLRSELVDAVRHGNAVFIVGAGVSLLATEGQPHASWLGLMEAGVERCADLDSSLPTGWRAANLKRLRGSDAAAKVRVAQEIENVLKRIPGRQYAKWLADTVGSLKIKNLEVIDALVESRASLITTNYDSLLEEGSGRDAVIWDQLHEMQAEILDPGNSIIHLHGHWRRPETVVFSYDDYTTVIGDPGSQAFLRALLSVKSVAFIGFGQGLEDPNFAALTTWMTTVLRSTGVAPVMLVRNQDYAKSQERYRPLGINSIPYGGEYRDLALYVSDIVSEAHIGRSNDNFIEFSWETISAKLSRLQRRITRNYSPDFVVAVSGPGNFAPAYCLAHWSNEPPLLAAVSFPRKPDRSAQNVAFETLAESAGWVHYASAKWDVYLPNIITHFPPGARALLFDDRVVGGQTQADIAAILKDMGYEVRRAALVIDPACVDSMDYYEDVIGGDFSFPWGGRYGRGERSVR
jgi:adenine/guanine phosphoribosyltransferase-like PRPP-binding protein